MEYGGGAEDDSSSLPTYEITIASNAGEGNITIDIGAPDTVYVVSYNDYIPFNNTEYWAIGAGIDSVYVSDYGFCVWLGVSLTDGGEIITTSPLVTENAIYTWNF